MSEVQEEQVQEEELEEQEEEELEVAEFDADSLLLNAKLQHLLAAYLPDEIDLDEELGFVTGITINDKGEVEGEARYRKPSTAPPAKKAARKQRQKQPNIDTIDFTKLVQEANKRITGYPV